MRADARRNRNAVMDAGARLLAERPSASMQEIADASGVGRTTVYRHFPAREDLIEALIARVIEEIREISDRVLSSDEPASEVMRRLAVEYVRLGHRWSFLASHRQQVLEGMREINQRFADYYARAQARGELRDDVPVEWIIVATRGILRAAYEDAREVSVEEAGRLAGETIVSAFGPR